MKLNFIKSILLSSTLMSLCLNIAQAGQWTIGGNVGLARNDVVKRSCSAEQQSLTNSTTADLGLACQADDSDTAYGLNVAYNFTDNLGIEFGSRSLGSYESQITIANGTFTNGKKDAPSANGGLTAMYLGVIGSYPISDVISIGGMIGAAKIESNLASEGKVTSSDDIEAMVSVYADYEFFKDWKVGLRYEYFNTEESIDALFLSLKYDYGYNDDSY